MKLKLLFLLVVAIPSVALAAGLNETESARNQIQTFLTREFSGDACTQNDENLATFNIEAQRIISETLGGACVYLNADTLHLVKNFKIESLKIYEKEGVAVVSFDEVATISGSLSDRKVTKAAKPVKIKYSLRKLKGNWVVYDPDEMHVSVAPITHYYESVVKGEEMLLRQDITADQRKVFAANRKIYECLLSLVE